MNYPTMKISDDYIAKIRQRATATLILSGHDQGADVSQWCGSVFNQLQEGSCTYCTTRDYILWLEDRYGWKTIIEPDVQAGYYFARKIYGDLSTDGGSTVQDAFQGSITYGVIPSSDEAYTRDTLFIEPPIQDVAFKATLLQNLPQNTTSVRSSLDNGIPVGVAVLVDQTLFTPADTPDGLIGVVDVYTQVPNEGHAVFIVGYKPHPTYKFVYRFQNSWGTDWGDKGFGWFTEAYLEKNLFEVCTLDIPKSLNPPEPNPKPQPIPKPDPVPTPPNPAPAYLSGVDVSKFQGNVNMQDVAKSCVFDFVKCIDGKTPIDPDFATNYANSIKAGIITGTYQVGYPIYESAQDAYNAYKAVVLANGGFMLPPALDLEAAGCGPCTPVQVTQWAVQWLAHAIKDYGQAIVYSNEDFFNTHIDTSKLPKGTLLWVANYSTEPKLNWTFWQHTDSAHIQGISTNVDTDYFKGALDDLKALIVKEGDNVTQSKVNINGEDYPSVVVNGDNYVLYTAFQKLPGFKMEYKNEKWYFTIPESDLKPVKVTLTYSDGSTQTL